MRVLCIVITYILYTVSIFAADIDQPQTTKRSIVLAPVTDLVSHPEFLYLRGTIRNVLRINLEKQETLQLVNNTPGSEAIIDAPVGFETYIASLAGAYTGATAIIGEYYVSRGNLNILVNVWELDTLRIKNSFVETVPADLDMLRNIEKMSANIAGAVARELPPTERDALFGRQIIASLRNKIDREDRLTEEIFSLHNEIDAVLFSGLSTGRNVVAWSEAGPFVTAVVSIGYTHLFDDPYEIRFGLEYLGFDLLVRDTPRRELSFEALAGYHTKSPFSFSADAGLSFSWEYNGASAALSYAMGLDSVNPEVTRVSIALPFVLGFSVYLSKNTFFALRFKYYGLSYAFESLPQSAYDVGNSRLLYSYGFSPWNFLCFSICIHAGARF